MGLDVYLRLGGEGLVQGFLLVDLYGNLTHFWKKVETKWPTWSQFASMEGETLGVRPLMGFCCEYEADYFFKLIS